MPDWPKQCKLLMVCCVLLSACAPAPEPVREVPEYPIAAFMGTTNFFGASISPDKSKVLVSSNATGIYNAYAVPVDGGEPVALTDSTTDTIRAVGYFPADERFLYLKDAGGNELFHLYANEPDGTVTDLTPGEGHRSLFFGWAWDDESFYVGTTERDKSFFDVYEYSVDDYSRELLYQNETGLDFQGRSPDEKTLALSKTNTTSDSDIYLYDVDSGELRLVTESEDEVANAFQSFSPDGGSFYMTTDEGSEFAQLVRYDLATGERETLVAPEWDVWYGYPSRHGKYLIVGINNDGRTEVRLYEAATMTQVELPAVPSADVSSIRLSRDEQTLAFYASSSRNPNDLYVQEIGGEPRRLTTSLSADLNADDLVDGEVARFASYDGVEIPGILYKPHGVSADNPAPALVWVHGGPGGQSRIGYIDIIQYLVNHGYVVYAINNRGSTGYGKTFNRMDDRRHGEADLGDCVASKQMLIDTGYVDPERIGIIGGSYGGYMVLAALTLAPEEFAVGVDIFGISNWVRTIENMPAWWGSFRDALLKEIGDPSEEGERERLTRISPLFHADKIVRPLMVLQGANDPRVLQAESDDIVEAARANGTPVEYIVFEDEGHGFVKKENQIEGFSSILAFLDQYLGKPAPAT